MVRWRNRGYRSLHVESNYGQLLMSDSGVFLVYA